MFQIMDISNKKPHVLCHVIADVDQRNSWTKVWFRCGDVVFWFARIVSLGDIYILTQWLLNSNFVELNLFFLFVIFNANSSLLSNHSSYVLVRRVSRFKLGLENLTLKTSCKAVIKVRNTLLALLLKKEQRAAYSFRIRPAILSDHQLFL